MIFPLNVHSMSGIAQLRICMACYPKCDYFVNNLSGAGRGVSRRKAPRPRPSQVCVVAVCVTSPVCVTHQARTVLCPHCPRCYDLSSRCLMFSAGRTCLRRRN